jgi:hypothetical protein
MSTSRIKPCFDYTKSLYRDLRRINISSAQNQELCKYRDFYNVNASDPENLVSIDNRTIAQFTLDYLVSMLREKGLSYSKSNVSAVSNKSYFKQLVKRFEENDHIKSRHNKNFCGVQGRFL